MKPTQQMTCNSLISASLAVAVGLLTSACGGSKTQVGAPPPSSKNALTGSASCTKDKCEPADLNVSANFAASGLLMGFAGEPVNWTFYGIDKNTQTADGLSSDRRVVVLLNDVPKGSSISPDKDSGELATEVRIDWTPDKPQRGKMEFIARDYDRCLLNESKEFCNKYIYHKEYDRRIPANNWEVLDKEEIQASAGGGSEGADNVVNVSNPDCGKPTTDSQINGQILNIGLKVLMGGGLESILPSLAGSVLGGSTQTTNPTEC
jgi:hypothetical protein